MSFPSTHPCLEHLQLARGFEAALDYGVPATGSNRRNAIFPWIRHPLLSLQEGCTPWLISAQGTPTFLLAVPPGDLQQILLPPPTCIPVHPVHNSASSDSWRRGASLYFTAQRFSPSDSPCQEQLCSLPHQPSWLHLVWDSVKGHRRFPQVRTHTTEAVSVSHVCDIQRTDTKLCQRSLSWYPYSLRHNPSPTEKVQKNVMWVLHWSREEFSQVSTLYMLL